MTLFQKGLLVPILWNCVDFLWEAYYVISRKEKQILFMIYGFSFKSDTKGSILKFQNQ